MNKVKEKDNGLGRAYWIIRGSGWAKCSKCHFTFSGVYDDDNFDNYCRKCGARMIDIRSKAGGSEND